MRKQSVRAVIDFAGSELALAILLGVSREQIRLNVVRKAFPTPQLVWLDLLTDGEFGPHNLKAVSQRMPFTRDDISQSMIEERYRSISLATETFNEVMPRLVSAVKKIALA